MNGTFAGAKEVIAWEAAQRPPVTFDDLATELSNFGMADIVLRKDQEPLRRTSLEGAAEEVRKKGLQVRRVTSE